MVPPYQPDGDHHGTSATVEYAVTALQVSHLIVLGHSQCGGVQGCIDMCKGHAPQLEEKTSFVGRWMDILKPKFQLVQDIEDEEQQARQFERQSVVASLENLMTFPFIEEKVRDGSLSLHGLWTDIGEGGLECYDPNSDSFSQV